MFLQLFVIVLAVSGHTLGHNDWPHERWLNDNYLFKWKVSAAQKAIYFRVEVNTKGWVGFGLTKHGKTTEADMVIGWVDHQGKTTFKDYWVNEFGSRSLDRSQDWKLKQGVENASHTVLEFCRHYITCDTENDLEIFENEYEVSNLVIAYSHLDPDNDPDSKNGALSDPAFEDIIHINLFNPAPIFEPKEKDIDDTNKWIINMTLPHSPTRQTMCQIIKNNFKKKRSIVKYQTVASTSMVINLDLAIFKCEKSIDKNAFLEHEGHVFPCSDKKNPLHFIRKKCKQMFLDTRNADEPVIFPDDVGLLIDPEISYFLLESQVQTENVTSTVSISIWSTRLIRKYEFGSQAFGLEPNGHWGMIVPPYQPHYRVASITDSHCLESDHFNRKGIYIFALTFDSQQAQGMEIRHYRNDKLARVLRINHYDPDYQTIRPLKEFIHFLKGDKIVVICDYNSMEETKSFTSSAEHCSINTFYYSKFESPSEEGMAWSRISYDTMLNITGLKEIEGYENGAMDQIIRNPIAYNNTKLFDFISENLKITNSHMLEQKLIEADMTECCTFHERTATTPKQCKLIKKPPGLYQVIINQRRENSCFINNSTTKTENEPDWMDSLNEMGNSFKVLMNPFEFSFDNETRLSSSQYKFLTFIKLAYLL